MKPTNVIGILSAWLVMAAVLFSQESTTPQPPAPDFVMNSAVPTRLGDLNEAAERLDNTQCNGHDDDLERRTTIGNFIGGAAKTVRVTRFLETIKSPETEVPQILKKVWSGQFQFASCYRSWAEGTGWSVEGVVEFEDGTRGKLITDGYHVCLQDHAGKNWFIRLGE